METAKLFNGMEIHSKVTTVEGLPAVIERKRSSCICAEGVSQGSKFTNGACAVTLSLIDGESERSQQDCKRAGGQDQEDQIEPDGEVPDAHGITFPCPQRRYA